MNSEAKNPFVAWRSRHPAGTLDAQTDVRIHQWVRVNHELLDLFDQFDYSIEPWLKGREKPEPHLVTFIAGSMFFRNRDFVRVDATELKVSSLSPVTTDLIRNMGKDRDVVVDVIPVGRPNVTNVRLEDQNLAPRL